MEFTEIFRSALVIGRRGPSAYEGERADVICRGCSRRMPTRYGRIACMNSHRPLSYAAKAKKSLMLEGARETTIGFIVTFGA
ncbi:MAG: hypothetical protein ACLTSG_09805 [Lachnospiraceae bacterium]